jgi:hypothetical protein
MDAHIGVLPQYTTGKHGFLTKNFSIKTPHLNSYQTNPSSFWTNQF